MDFSNSRHQHFESSWPIKTLGMSEWISNVLNSLASNNNDNVVFQNGNNKKNSIGNLVCSSEYLSGALKIALFLADQLTAVEEEKTCEADDGRPCGIDKQDRIMNESHYHEIHMKWSRCISIIVAGQNETRSGVGGGEGAGNNQGINYLNVQSATFIEEHDYDSIGTSFNNLSSKEMMYCFSAILVELFSGGQVIVAQDNKMQSRQGPMQAFFSRSNTVAGHVIAADLSQMSVNADRVEESITGVDGMAVSNKRKASFASNSKSVERTNSSSIDFDSITGERILRLRSLGLPSALCDLIKDMRGQNSEEFGVKNEAYQRLSDVRDDLKIMLDSPENYLCRFDFMKACIRFDNKGKGGECGGRPILFGREAELEALKQSFFRSVSSECEVAQIFGASGIGKSALCTEFAAYATGTDTPCIFLSGRFDRMQSSRPFHAIGSAFDDYCSWLRTTDQSTVDKVSSMLKNDIGRDVGALASLMPNLPSIIGNIDDSKNEDIGSVGVVDAQKRLRYLFCQFVKVISKCHDEPVLLYLDDSHLMDSASVALLNELLMMLGSAIGKCRFFFLLCCRENEMNETHPLTTMLTLVNTYGIKRTIIRLTPMSKETVNELVSVTLSLLPRLTRPLANILHHRTKGNPIFIKQLMFEIRRKDYLTPSLTQHRWVWEISKIRGMKIPESVATFLLSSLHRLSPEVVSALFTLSCFGASAEITFIHELEEALKEDIVKHLDTAVAESILDKRKGAYYFIHDKLQEAAYSVIDREQRRQKHFSYGLSLATIAEREGYDELKMIASTQLNLGGPELIDKREQGAEIANLNLVSGKIAMKKSDFFLAYSFFDYGISYLRKGHWERNYSLSLELYNLFATCAFMNAEYGNLKIILQEIMHRAKCVEDKLNALSISIRLEMFSGKVDEAIKMTTNVLKTLGEDIPDIITPSVTHELVEEAKKKLAGISDEVLSNYPLMVDPMKNEVMKLLELLLTQFAFADYRACQPFIASKMILISLESGFSDLSPVAFAFWSNYLILVEKKELGEGIRWTKFALSLLRVSSSRICDASVIIKTTHSKMYIEPLQSTLEFFLEAHKAAMKSGATGQAVSASMFYDICSFWVGKKLNVVCDSMRDTIAQAKFYNAALFLTMLLPVYSVAMRMSGEADKEQTDSNESAANSTERIYTSKLTSHVLMKSFHGFHEALIFRELDKAEKCANTFYETQSQSTTSMSAAMFMREFYFGLVSFWLGREVEGKNEKRKRLAWLSRGSESKDALDNLAINASMWNFENKAILLQAEEQFTKGNFDKAGPLYDAAVSSAKEHKFLNEEALANELAGHFYLDTGNKVKSILYFSQAFQKYSEWGAAVKAKTLTKYLI